MAGAGGEFVEGWLVAQVLGEGAYGEVRLLVNARTGESVALKATRASAGEDGAGAGGAASAKEAALHRALKHPHVLRCYGARTHQNSHFMFLEYAVGGELFDRIEPDVGMEASAAQRYWRQLLAGVEYLHAQGVAHRDVKPENLLLDAQDNLKISDFGMATIFRYKGTERLLSRRCGTLPYVGPEVLAGAYRAEPADLWSCGVVLLTMLAGELPWEQASVEAAGYAAWAGGTAWGARPWSKLATGALALLRRLLAPVPAARPSLRALLHHPWTTQPLTAMRRESDEPVWVSQPAPACQDTLDGADLSSAGLQALVSFSQPHAPDDMLLGTQPSQHASQSVMQRLVRRMTRFFVSVDATSALEHLTDALQRHGYSWKLTQPGVVTISCARGREAPLVLKAWLVEMGGRVLLDFRLSRGCGLEFKRRFLQLQTALNPIVARHAPDTLRLSAPVQPMSQS